MMSFFVFNLEALLNITTPPLSLILIAFFYTALQTLYKFYSLVLKLLNASLIKTFLMNLCWLYHLNNLNLFNTIYLNYQFNVMTTKTFLLNISVDISQLELTFKEADPDFTFDSTEAIADAVVEECGWMSSSGISVYSIQEVTEN